MTDLDLHADAEDWPGNLDEDECEHCHGPRVVFIPVWDNGSGILTESEIYECIRKAKAELIIHAEADAAKLDLKPRGAMPEDMVMSIEGYRDGSYMAIIISKDYGSYGQTFVKYGVGSTHRGSRAWRRGLSNCTWTEEITDDEDRENDIAVYRGYPGSLKFQIPHENHKNPVRPDIAEELRAREAVRDRSRPTTSWERHKAAVRRRAEEQARRNASGDGF